MLKLILILFEDHILGTCFAHICTFTIACTHMHACTQLLAREHARARTLPQKGSMDTAIQLINVFTWSLLMLFGRVSGSQSRCWAYTTNPHKLQTMSSAINPGKFNHNALREKEVVHFKTSGFYGTLYAL